ncbi:unnamed protein product [Brassica rapa subsp. trilocularis]
MEVVMDTAMKAVVVMEVMVEGVSVDTMVVVGGGGYSSGGDCGGYSGGGYGGGSDGYRSGGGGGYGGCGVRREGSYSGGVSGSTRLPSTHLMSTRLPSTHLSSTHLPSMHLFCPQRTSIYPQNHRLILYISPNTSQPSALKKQNNQNHENFTP